MGDINPQIDLVYVCFLQGRAYKPLKNKKFHEVSAGIPGVSWEKSRYGKVRYSLAQNGGFPLPLHSYPSGLRYFGGTWDFPRCPRRNSKSSSKSKSSCTNFSRISSMT